MPPPPSITWQRWRLREEAARANLDLLNAGATPEQLAAAEAQLAQADANRQAAEAGFAALTAGARPEAVAAARLRLEQARASYTTLSAVTSSEQIDSLTQARATAQSNLNGPKTPGRSARQQRRPVSALEPLPPGWTTRCGGPGRENRLERGARRQHRPFPPDRSWRAALGDCAAKPLPGQSARGAPGGIADMPQVALDAARTDVDTAQQLVDDFQGSL